jgi:hypothetical protein
MIALVWVSCASSAPAPYTSGQVKAVFQRSGVQLAVSSRDTFPAGKKLSALLVLHPASSPAGPGDTGIPLKVAVYEGAASAHAAYTWVHQYTGNAELIGNLLVTGGGGITGRQSREAQWALYQLAHPNFYR